jgi:FlaG/FlaF family flagellin (archaellin)
MNYRKSFPLNHSEEAVSPVVGVMLMLVVTIIIAAVVSAFAGGLTGSQSKTPQASFQITTGWAENSTYSTESTGSMTAYTFSIKDLGGDPIQTKDTNLITYLTLSNGTVVRNVETPATTPVCMYGNYPDGSMCVVGPYLYDQQKYGYPCTNGPNPGPAWFGNATWMPGDSAITDYTMFTANMLGVSNDDLLNAASNHTQLEVILLHVPTGRNIMDQKVNLQ